jgi:TPM domain
MRRVLVALGVLGVLLLGAGPAWADPPVEVDRQLTDLAGVLGADAAGVRSALDRLQSDDGIVLYVVLVAGFDDPGDRDWATATAELSELEAEEMLLAVDVTAGTYQWFIGDEFELSESDVDEVLVSRFEPRLAEGAWADSVLAVTDGMTSGPGSFLGGAADVGPWSGTTTAVVGAVVLLTLGGAHLLSRRRSSTPSSQ